MNLLAKEGFRHHVRMVTPAFSDCINKLGVDEKTSFLRPQQGQISLDVLDKPAAPANSSWYPPSLPPHPEKAKPPFPSAWRRDCRPSAKSLPGAPATFHGTGVRPQGRSYRRRQKPLTPAEEINMHFTGDFHAITSAHNLISAIIDNAMFFHTLNIDERKVIWKRVMDMNDRSLRSIIVGSTSRGSPRNRLRYHPGFGNHGVPVPCHFLQGHGRTHQPHRDRIHDG